MAKIYRYTAELFAGGYVPSPLCVVSCHVQTDVPALGTEPGADYIRNELDQHFSTSGTNMLKLLDTCDTATQLRRTVLYERVADEGVDLPEVSAKDWSLSGTFTASGDRAPAPCCAWLKFSTGVATRSARGGTHSPPLPQADVLAGTGEIASGTSYWTRLNTLAAAFADHLNNNFQTTGDINFVIYSRTRRRRDQSPFTWKLTAVAPSQQARWLRRRQTAP